MGMKGNVTCERAAALEPPALCFQVQAWGLIISVQSEALNAAVHAKRASLNTAAQRSSQSVLLMSYVSQEAICGCHQVAINAVRARRDPREGHAPADFDRQRLSSSAATSSAQTTESSQAAPAKPV